MAVAFWAALVADAIAVPMNPQTKTDKLHWLLEHCGAAALVTEERLTATFVPAVRRAAPLRALVSRGGPVDELDGAVDFAKVTAENSDALPPSEATEGDLAALIYTSGSTGSPRA